MLTSREEKRKEKSQSNKPRKKPVGMKSTTGTRAWYYHADDPD